MSTLVLASTSPYRQKLLAQLGVSFDTSSPKVDEESFKNQGLDPAELSQLLAEEKAKAVFEQNKGTIVLGADQVCVFQQKTLGKPLSKENAFEQLRLLSGTEHRLVTSYCLLSKNQKTVHTNVTTLKMKELTDEEIKDYIDYDSPLHCCGSYKIESGGIALFDEIKASDFTAIIGLPLLQLAEDLQKFKVPLWQAR